MDNHLHLVIREGTDNLSRALKRIATSYAHYFNKKYNRIGHVFQDRFKSECIEDDRGLFAVIRYVHQNPWKAGIGRIDNYRWSSYKSYLQDIEPIPEVKEILDMISTNRVNAVKEFALLSHECMDEQFIDIGAEKELREDTVEKYVIEYLLEKEILLEELHLFNNRAVRNELIRIILDKSNLSKRAIANVLGINREMVRMLSKEPSP